MRITKEELSKIEVFSNISKESLTLLSQYSMIKKYSAGSHIFYDKDDVDTLYIVISGVVSLYKINEKGQKRVIFMLGLGKMVNEVIIQELPASINCEVFEEALILCYNKYDFLSVMEQDFILTKNIICSLSTKVRRMYRQLKNTTPSIRVEKRLAAKLWKLSKDHGIPCDGGILINMNISITYLADLMGSQRETISKALKVLTTKGLIQNYDKKIMVCSQELLAEFFKTP